MSKRVITAGSDPFPPFQDLLEDGSIVGIDIDRLCKVFAETDYELKIVLCNMKDAFDAFEAKTMDSVFLIAKTNERLDKGYIFSNFVRNSVNATFSNAPNVKIGSYKDIVDKNLVYGYVPIFANPQEVLDLPKENTKHYGDTLELLKALSNKEIDVASFDKDLCEYYVKELGLNPVYENPSLTKKKSLYMCFNDEEVCREFNKALAKIGF